MQSERYTISAGLTAIVIQAGGGRLDDVVEDEETRSSPSIRSSATVRAKSTTKRDPRRALMDVSD